MPYVTHVQMFVLKYVVVSIDLCLLSKLMCCLPNEETICYSVQGEMMNPSKEVSAVTKVIKMSTDHVRSYETKNSCLSPRSE